MRLEARESVGLFCPFCRSKMAKPAEILLNGIERALGGRCETCGALYILDPTSKNVGEIMMQALGVAAAELSKDVSQLAAGEDYDDVVLSYDWRTDRSSGPAKGFMDGCGRLYVLRIKKKTG